MEGPSKGEETERREETERMEEATRELPKKVQIGMWIVTIGLYENEKNVSLLFTSLLLEVRLFVRSFVRFLCWRKSSPVYHRHLCVMVWVVVLITDIVMLMVVLMLLFVLVFGFWFFGC